MKYSAHPYRFEAIGMRPIVRLVRDFIFAQMTQHLSEWAVVFAKWIEEGETPYKFVHVPDDFHALWIARIFHNLLAKRCKTVGTHPKWPAEREGKDSTQLDLLQKCIFKTPMGVRSL